MQRAIAFDHWTAPLFEILDEVFESHHGIFLDRGTSLFETLAGLDAAVASMPVGGKGATIAAQVAHVEYYLQVLGGYLDGQSQVDVDWKEIWRTVNRVTPDEWFGIQRRLRTTYERTLTLLRRIDDWEDETAIGGALAIAVHTAYHLGGIRQALGEIRRRQASRLPPADEGPLIP